jgi:hypothetical protein
VTVQRNDHTNELTIQEGLVYSLLDQIVSRFGHLSIPELEAFVYETEPVKKYLAKVKTGFKKSTGGYVLRGDCIKIGDHNNPVTQGRQLALVHLQKYPSINFEQQLFYSQELASLSLLRPQQ